MVENQNGYDRPGIGSLQDVYLSHVTGNRRMQRSQAEEYVEADRTGIGLANKWLIESIILPGNKYVYLL